MPSNHLILCHPLLLLPSIFPSIRVFSKESVLCIRWPKYWTFSFSISPSNEYSGLISFRTDWLDLLAVQGTLKSLFQHHSSKASILRRSAFSWSGDILSGTPTAKPAFPAQPDPPPEGAHTCTSCIAAHPARVGNRPGRLPSSPAGLLGVWRPLSTVKYEPEDSWPFGGVQCSVRPQAGKGPPQQRHQRQL